MQKRHEGIAAMMVRDPHEVDSPEARALLSRHVRSVEHLETLLLLAAQPERSWSVSELAATLDTDAAVIEAVVGDLRSSGFATEPPEAPTRWRFREHSPELLAQVALLETAYARSRIAVLVHISRDAVSRVRKRALHLFAQSFLSEERGKR
jgi:hypothetical protein